MGRPKSSYPEWKGYRLSPKGEIALKLEEAMSRRSSSNFPFLLGFSRAFISFQIGGRTMFRLLYPGSELPRIVLSAGVSSTTAANLASVPGSVLEGRTLQQWDDSAALVDVLTAYAYESATEAKRLQPCQSVVREGKPRAGV